MSISFSLLLLTAPPVSGHDVAAAPSTDEHSTVETVTLSIEHDALLEKQMATAAEDSAYFVREDSVKALREQHGVEVVEDDDVPAIIVSLAWEDYERAVYRIEVSTQRPGESRKAVEEFTATCIDSTSLSREVLARFPAALEQLGTPSVPEPALSSDPIDVEPIESAEPAEDPGKRRSEGRGPLGVMGKVGTGLLASGAVGLVAGGIVFAQGRQIDNPSSQLLRPEGRNYRPPGVAVMVTGGVLAAAGVALLVLDRVRARRSAPDVARLSFQPSDASAGLALRF